MKKIWNEFKDSAVKGNAVISPSASIIGAAFGSIITSLVKDVIMPPISVLSGLDSQTSLSFCERQGWLDGILLRRRREAGAITWNYGNSLRSYLIFLL